MFSVFHALDRVPPELRKAQRQTRRSGQVTPSGASHRGIDHDTFPEPLLESGRTLGAFRLHELLRQDSRAATYRVRDERNGQEHALEVLADADRRHFARVQDEAVLVGRLDHPNVVAPTELVDVNGRIGLLQELVVGPRLDRWLHADAGEDIVSRLRVWRGVVAACAHAHSLGFSHLCLRPSRVVVSATLKDGKTEMVPRVSGFGVAKALATERGRYGGLTTIARTSGISPYSAPEQSQDAGSGDARSDVYSLGCILYELLCGIGPFSSSDSLSSMQDRREGRFRDPREFVPWLPDGLHRLIRDTLQPDPLARPASAVDVLRAIDIVLEDLGAGHQGGAWGDEDTDGLPLGSLLVLSGIPALGLLIGTGVVFLT